jgi:hypothetical protein
VNERNAKMNSDFITDETPGLQRRDLLLLGGLSAIWALAIALAPGFLFGANSQPFSPTPLLKGKPTFSSATATMKSRTGSGSHRPKVVGHNEPIPQNQIHPGAAVKQ